MSKHLISELHKYSNGSGVLRHMAHGGPTQRQITYYYDDATVITVLLRHKNNGVDTRMYVVRKCVLPISLVCL